MSEPEFRSPELKWKAPGVVMPAWAPAQGGVDGFPGLLRVTKTKWTSDLVRSRLKGRHQNVQWTPMEEFEEGLKELKEPYLASVGGEVFKYHCNKH